MTGAPAEQDNSIEDILASIRQIISEDDPKPEETPAVADSPVAPELAVTADDVFELVDRVVAEEEIPPPVAPEPAPAPVMAAPEPISAPIAHAPTVDSLPADAIFGDAASAATLGAFAKLSETVLVERQRAIAGSNVTLEDIVKELLSPILRQWVDAHVPGIVERLVREELEKLARQAREG